MACDQTRWTLHEGELDLQDVRDLLALHFSSMRATSPPDACHVLPVERLREPRIHFFSLRAERGLLLGVGALKELGDDHGEIKSMRTAPDALGQGVGGYLLAHLLSVATEMGMSRISLETGSSKDFHAANRLYKREGFVPCGPFGDYRETPFTRFWTRLLPG